MVSLKHYETMVMIQRKDFHLTHYNVSCYKNINLCQENKLKVTSCPKEVVGCQSVLA